MKRISILYFLLLSGVILPRAGFGEDTNSTVDLFGITVTQTQQVSQAEMQYRLGTLYYAGDGMETNLTKAVACFLQAAELGHARARFNLGMCYMNGAGVEQSDEAAAKWFKQAAAQGIKEACYPLGMCHYNLGQYTDAYAWALYAEFQGDSRLKEMIEPLYSEDEITAGIKRFEELKKTVHEKERKPE